MKFPLGWARDFVDLPDDLQAISDRLTLIGYMTEHVDRVRPAWREKVTATLAERVPSGLKKLDAFTFRTDTSPPFDVRVLAPDAFNPEGRLAFELRVGRVLEVKQQKGEIFEISLDVGPAGQARAIAHKMSPSIGSKWAVLLIGVGTGGARLASEADVGYTTNSADPVVLPDYYETGKPLAEEMTEIVFDLEVRQNRADCLGVIGLARDLAAGMGVPFKGLSAPSPKDAALNVNEFASLKIEAPDLVRRFAIQVIRDVKIRPSPRWLADRVVAGGMRSINNVVDITNYVMLETGQPLHAFDYDRLDNRDIILRRARPGEKMPAIDEKSYDLDDDMLVVANRNAGLALAGIIGGKESEITDSTSNIMLDAAHYNQTSIRKTSRKLMVRTEASTRLEKYLDPEGVMPAIQRATQLILEMGGGQCCREPLDYYEPKWKPREIPTESQRVNELLGTEFTSEQMSEYLDRLEIPSRRNNGTLVVSVPSWRSDLSQPADVAEEVARVYGYERIPAQMLSSETPHHVFEQMSSFGERLRDVMSGFGFDEVITDALTNPEVIDEIYAGAPDRKPRVIALANPPSRELQVLRPDLMQHLLETVMINHRSGRKRLTFFEIGQVFLQGASPGQHIEKTMMSAVLAGAAQHRGWCGPEQPFDAYHAKGLAEAVFNHLGITGVTYEPVDHPWLHPGRSGRAMRAEGRIAVFGQLHPRQKQVLGMKAVDACLLEFEVALLEKLARPVEDYHNPYRHEAVLLDMNVVIDRSVSASELTQAVSRHGGEFLRSVGLLDLYEGEHVPEGKKSVTFSLRFQVPDRTLQLEEVQPAMKAIQSGLATEFGATLRA